MNEDLQSDRAALADTVRRFAQTEIAPHVQAWDDAGEFPRALYARAAELGLLGLGYPEALGGTPASHALKLPAWVALARWGASGGVLASLFSHNIGLPPILRHGSEALQQEVVPGRVARREDRGAGDHRARTAARTSRPCGARRGVRAMGMATTG
jgi:acyl-CoA dehydrogenase